MKFISIKTKKLKQFSPHLNKLFVSLFSFIILFNSLIFPVVASDPSEVSAPEGVDLGDLPIVSIPPPAVLVPISSYNGTTLLDDLDDSESDIYFVDFSDYPSDDFRPFAFRGEVGIRYFYLDHSTSDIQIKTSYDYLTVDLDSNLSISFRKNTGNGVLMHSIRYTQNSSILNLDQTMFFPDLSLDDYQGFYCSVTDLSNNLETSILNGSYCEPTWNVTYVKNTVTYPGYFADFSQVYANIVIPSELLEQAALGQGYINIYAIPTYAGQYTLREFQTNNIIKSVNSYGKILDSYHSFFVGLNSGNFRYYYTFYDATTSYNNLIPNPQRFAASEYLDKGPLFEFSLKGLINGELNKVGSFPKFYLDSTSDISFYIASETQFNAYQSSDQKVADDNNIAKNEYDEKSDEFQEALKGFEQLPKPDYTREDVKLPENSIESIDELSGILSIIWEDKMVKEMLIISLTFVFVGYILFGKR